MNVRYVASSVYMAILMLALSRGSCEAIGAEDTYEGDPIPAHVERLYQSGLRYLKLSQSDDGSWPGSGNNGPAISALAVLSVLAHGDDPNYGPYAGVVRKGLEYIISKQRQDNGYIGPSMYNHGFATLALAESYGVIDDERVGPALEKAVELILTSQASNARGGWRYSPESKDADATVSGAQMLALFAAKNAGISVPDESIERALKYFRSLQSGDGGFGYSGAGGATPISSAIGTLVFALAGKKDAVECKAGLKFIKIKKGGAQHWHYNMYYSAQAFFHSDMNYWEKWNRANISDLIKTQSSDGSWHDGQGMTFGTAASLLSMALNYRYLPIYER